MNPIVKSPSKDFIPVAVPAASHHSSSNREDNGINNFDLELQIGWLWSVYHYSYSCSKDSNKALIILLKNYPAHNKNHLQVNAIFQELEKDMEKSTLNHLAIHEKAKNVINDISKGAERIYNVSSPAPHCLNHTVHLL